MIESFRSKSLKIQRANYEKSLNLIKESLGLKKKFIDYENEYHIHLHNYEGVSTPAILFRKIAASNITFIGDYHTLYNSQKAIFRIIKTMHKKRKIILCLEMFHSEDQKYINLFLQNKISEIKFLKIIDYKKKWGYNWNHWVYIVNFCKDNNIPIIGINSEQNETNHPLRKRDIHSAKIIAKEFIKNPDKLIIVVDGDFHIAPNHLPKEIKKCLNIFNIDVIYTIVYQNSENIYWQLAKESKEDEDVIKIDSNSFCVMNTTPTNKLQSYLNWLEYSEDAYCERNWKWDESNIEKEGYSIPELIKTQCEILDLPYPEHELNRLNIYYSDNLNFISIIQNILELKPTISLITKKMKNNEGFLLEYFEENKKRYIIYLANTSLSMAAEEAAHFINVALRTSFRGEIFYFDKFYQNVLMEAIGFYGSKIIVPKRKCNTISDIRRFIGMHKNKKLKTKIKNQLKIARFILQHNYLEKQITSSEIFKKKFHTLYKHNSYISHAVSTQLGYILGTLIYKAVNKGYIASEEIRILFYQAFSMPEEAFKVYLNLNKRLTLLGKKVN